MKIYKKQYAGFTLIEMMMVIAIMAILVTIVVPSYQDYMRKGKRSDGVSGLLKMQLSQEKWRANNTTYATFANLGSPTTEHGYYVLSVANNTATGYIGKATAQGEQAKDTEGGTSCKVLTMTVSSSGVVRSPSDCW